MHRDIFVGQMTRDHLPKVHRCPLVVWRCMRGGKEKMMSVTGRIRDGPHYCWLPIKQLTVFSESRPSQQHGDVLTIPLRAHLRSRRSCTTTKRTFTLDTRLKRMTTTLELPPGWHHTGWYSIHESYDRIRRTIPNIGLNVNHLSYLFEHMSNKQTLLSTSLPPSALTGKILATSLYLTHDR